MRDFDHADWVQRQIPAWKAHHNKAADRKLKMDGKGWLCAPDTLNDFHRRAFTVLGMVGNNIYNAPISWHTIFWRTNAIGVIWKTSLATFDFDQLTRLVFLAHEARCRCDVSPAGHCLQIFLSQRATTGGLAERHPNLDEAVATFREHLPADHPVIFRHRDDRTDARTTSTPC